MADTSTSFLSVYVGLHRTNAHVVMDKSVLAPGQVMLCEPGRSWIPMLVDPQKALERAKWGAEELGLTVTDPKQDLILLHVKFSALGFGHYFLRKMLSTRDWKAWRFHGELVVPQAVNTDGAILAEAIAFEVE